MAEKTWKRIERRVAQIVGGVRNPVDGRGDKPDVSSDHFSIEVKHRTALPKWIGRAWLQAQRGAKDSKRIPLVYIHQKHKRLTDGYVIIKLGDFMKCIEGLE